MARLPYKNYQVDIKMKMIVSARTETEAKEIAERIIRYSRIATSRDTEILNISDKEYDYQYEDEFEDNEAV